MVSKGLGEAEVELVEISQVSLESTNIENEDKESDFHFCSQMATVSTDMAIICNYWVKTLGVHALETSITALNMSVANLRRVLSEFERLLNKFECLSSKF